MSPGSPSRAPNWHRQREQCLCDVQWRPCASAQLLSTLLQGSHTALGNRHWGGKKAKKIKIQDPNFLCFPLACQQVLSPAELCCLRLLHLEKGGQASGEAGTLHPAVPVFLLCVSLLFSPHGPWQGTSLPPRSWAPRAPTGCSTRCCVGCSRGGAPRGLPKLPEEK